MGEWSSPGWVCKNEERLREIEGVLVKENLASDFPKVIRECAKLLSNHGDFEHKIRAIESKINEMLFLELLEINDFSLIDFLFIVSKTEQEEPSEAFTLLSSFLDRKDWRMQIRGRDPKRNLRNIRSPYRAHVDSILEQIRQFGRPLGASNYYKHSVSGATHTCEFGIGTGEKVRILWSEGGAEHIVAVTEISVTR